MSELDVYAQGVKLTSKRTSKLMVGKRESPPFLALDLLGLVS